LTKRILVVDDEPDISEVVKKALSLYGFEVDAYNDAEEALSKFDVGRYELLLLDYKLPNMTGFELYKRMKEKDDKVKACFLTGADTTYLEEAKNEQITDINPKCYVQKPVRMDVLAKQLNQILEG